MTNAACTRAPPQLWPLLVTRGVCNIAAKQSIILLICMAVADHSRPLRHVPLDSLMAFLAILTIGFVYECPSVGQALNSS